MIIISVTGAFRTGKSFLLNYLLLYLRHLESGAEGDWLTGENCLVLPGAAAPIRRRLALWRGTEYFAFRKATKKY